MTTWASVESERSAVEPWNLYSERQRWAFLTILCLVAVCGTFDYFVLGVVLEPIKHEFNVSDTQLGVLGGLCFALCYAVTALPFARWSDRGNRPNVLAFALLGWSVMTVFSGLARSFVQLGISRLGVGAMQPGQAPPSQALIADYFPPERRSSALAVTIAGSAMGYLIGVALGGYIAATLGWRNSFLLSGFAGIALAILAKAVLREPRNELRGLAPNLLSESLGQAMARLCAKKSFVCSLLGLSLLMFFSLGVTTFLPSFMIRTLGASLKEVSVTWGFAVALSNLWGTLAGGWIAEYLSRKDLRWCARLPALACLVSAFLYWLAMSAAQLRTFIPLQFAAELVLWTGTFAVWPAIHAVCGNARRSMAVAITQLAYIILGSGLGPVTAGALSDALRASHGGDALRYALQIMILSLIPAALAFYGSGPTLLKDLES